MMMMMMMITIMTNRLSSIHYVIIKMMAQQYRCQLHRQYNTQIQNKYTKVKVKVKQFHYSSGEALRVPGGLGS
jgi:hypothetical protein